MNEKIEQASDGVASVLNAELDCVFITVAAVRQMFVTNAKTVRTAIEKSI